MPIWKQRLLARLQEQAGDGTGQGQSTGGGGTDDGQGAGQGSNAGQGEGQKPADGAVDDKKISDADARLLRENMKRKEENEQLRAQLGELSAVAEAVKKLGGLDTISKLVQTQREAEEKQLEAKGEWERLKERMANEHKSALEQAMSKASETEQRLQSALKQINDLTIGTAFSQSQFIQQDLVLPPSKARVVFGDYFELVDGQVVGYDKPRGSDKRTPLVDAQGSVLPFESALRKIVEQDPERDHLLRAKGKAGAGSETRKETTVKTQAGEGDSLSKISSGLGGLNIKLN